MDTLDHAKRVLLIEAKAIQEIADRLGNEIVQAVELILQVEGKVVVVGMGKSGLVGSKIAATLASTGTPSFFMHAAEAAHGDLGMVHKNDLALVISNSGETDETISLLPAFRRLGLPIIAITGKTDSRLGQTADVVLNAGVSEEACPLGLAPTASSTAQLALGDALAVALLERRGLSEQDFARFHPAGTLGKRLLTKVQDLMHSGDDVARVQLDTPVMDALLIMSAKHLGTTTVEDEQGNLQGIITDGDVRRALQKYPDFQSLQARDIMTANPKTISPHVLATRAAHVMETHSISCLLVHNPDDTEKTVGMIHLHDLLKAGII